MIVIISELSGNHGNYDNNNDNNNNNINNDDNSSKRKCAPKTIGEMQIVNISIVTIVIGE